MKKTLALLLALAMVFSTVTVAFAEEAIGADAQACVTLGMLQGDGNGVDAAYLAKTPSRLQAAIMFLRLKGYEDEALAYTGTENFADVDQVAWAGGKAILGYLKANPELGWIGKGDNTFDPYGPVKAQDYYKVMLEALGYKQNTTEVIGDFTYPGVFEFAASVGLTKVATVTDFTNNDVATATVEALKANVKGTEKTLAASLVEANVITEAAAVAAGVYTVAPVELAVESVTTDNLKQLTVKFNKEITAAGDEDNYSLETDGAAVLDSSSDFALQADNKTVVITLTTDAAQQEVVELTVKDIEAVDGSTLDETVVEDVELFDKTIPSAVNAEVVGNDVIKVTFSEPIETINADDFEVDGGEIIVRDAVPANAERTEFNVGLYSTLEEGTISIEAGTGVKDYAGFGIPKKSFDLSVVEDTTAPVVVGFKDADPTEVTLIFNEDIQFVDVTPVLTDFYHTNTSQEAASVSIQGNELRIVFDDGSTTNTLPEGRAYIYVNAETVADLWDNENAKQSYAVEVELDTTAPTVTKVEAGSNEDQLEVTFSEAMDVSTTEDEDNYTVLDKDGKVVENIISSVSLDGDREVATILFTEELSGDYSIVIEDVEDDAENAIVKTTMAFNITDVTAPLFTDFEAKLYNAGAADQMLKVNFKEAMAVTGKYSVLDVEKYVLGTDNLADLTDVVIKAVDGNKAVEITIPSLVDDPDDGKNFTAAADLTIARVADAADNYTAALVSGAINVDPEGNVTVDTVELTAADTLVVTLNDRLTKFVSGDFTVFADVDGGATYDAGEAYAVERIRHTLNSDGMSVVTFTLDEAINTDGTLASGDIISVAVAAGADSENVYGETLGVYSAHADDKAAPELDTAIFNAAGHTITLTFTEDIDAATFIAGAKNGFSVSGGTLTGATLSGNVVTLSCDADDVFTVNTNVYYNSVFGLADADGNEIANFSETDRLE